MGTRRDDDYLTCKHYYNHIDNVSSEYKDFITFEHNTNHYFAWVNDGKVILRSEAYPSEEKMIRGIKAIIKNRDIHERYSIDSQHGVHFLVLWGGGDHQKHTGNMAKHNEIGRSCPVKDRSELLALMGFRGKDFVNGIFNYSSKVAGKSGANIAAATTAAASTLASTKGSASSRNANTAQAATSSAGTSSGFNWKWLLPLLLLIPLFLFWKGCNGDKTVAKAKTEVKKAKTKVEDAAALAATKAKETADAAAAKLKAEADAAKLAAEEKAAELKAAAEKKSRGGSGTRTGNSSGSTNLYGNKNSGF